MLCGHCQMDLYSVTSKVSFFPDIGFFPVFRD